MSSQDKLSAAGSNAIELDGVRIPKMGLGTWNLRGGRAVRAVRTALELGYRHIDTAEMYRNEAEIGQAIIESGLARDELFIVSKVWKNHMQAHEVVQACRRSCQRLRVDHLDMYLVHWPNSRVPIGDTMAGMAQAVSDGLATRIGVSNFSVADWKQAIDVCPQAVVCNQVRLNVRYHQDSIVGFAGKHGLAVVAYTPLAKGRLAREPELRRIAERMDRTPLQVALRWLIQQGPVGAIPKASNRGHLRENLGALGFELSPGDMATIGAIAH
jgi:2,5-diketo-D-gluconate reductase B